MGVAPNPRNLIRFTERVTKGFSVRLSSMADYAVIVMVAAAGHCGASLRLAAGPARGAAFNATQLANETGLPAPTVQKLVSRLVAAGLLKSTRGVGGGLRLARPSAAINLAEIIEAVEGPVALTQCVDTDKPDCAMECGCSARPHWPVVNKAVRGALAEVALSTLVRAPMAAMQEAAL